MTGTEGASLLELIAEQQRAHAAEQAAVVRQSRAVAAFNEANRELQAAKEAYSAAVGRATLADAAVEVAEQKSRDGGVIRLI